MIGLVSIIYPPMNFSEWRKNFPKESGDRLLESYKEQISKQETSVGEGVEKLDAKWCSCYKKQYGFS